MHKVRVANARAAVREDVIDHDAFEDEVRSTEHGLGATQRMTHHVHPA